LSATANVDHTPHDAGSGASWQTGAAQNAPPPWTAGIRLSSLLLDIYLPPSIGFGGCCLHGDLEHAVVERGLRTVGDDPFGQRDRAVELTVLEFAVEVALALFLVLVPPLSADAERVSPHFHLDVVALESGQLGTDDETVALLDGFDSRRPEALAASMTGRSGQP
jgi:hypothetical protein